jgi:hypothetical protein
MRTRYKWTIIFTAATPILLGFTMLLAGGGHGTYTPIITFFPFGMMSILYHIEESYLYALIIAQLPVFGIILDYSNAKGKIKSTLIVLIFVDIALIGWSTILYIRKY